MTKTKKIRVSDDNHLKLADLSKGFGVTMDEMIMLALDYLDATCIFPDLENDAIDFNIMTRHIDYIPDEYKNQNEFCNMLVNNVNVVDFKDENIRTNLVEGDKIIIPDERITIHFTYPLDNPVNFEYTHYTGTSTGFSRYDIFRCIYEGYTKIYKEELETGKLESKESIPKYNRPSSNGKYGIWGHYIDDLVIEGITYKKKNKELILDIGS